jgi:hypothetical protein
MIMIFSLKKIGRPLGRPIVAEILWNLSVSAALGCHAEIKAESVTITRRCIGGAEITSRPI